MQPILFMIHDRIPIYSYGLLMVVSFACAIWIALREAKHLQIHEDHVIGAAITAIIAGLVGARIMALFTAIDEISVAPDPWKVVMNAGYVWYGGMIGGMVAVPVYAAIKKIPLLAMCDLFAPGAALGLAFGRLGCFMAGCCYGRPTDMPWAVTFSNPKTFASPMNTPLHPTQLYEMFMTAIVFGVLIWIRRRTFTHRPMLSEARSKKKDKSLSPLNNHTLGVVFSSYLMMSAVIRFISEGYRSSTIRGVYLGGISRNQIIAILMFAFGAMLFAFVRKKKASA